MLLPRDLGRLLAQVPCWSFLLGQAPLFRILHPIPYRGLNRVPDTRGQESEFWPQGKTEGDFGLSRADFRNFVHDGNVDEMDRIWLMGLLHLFLDGARFYYRRNFMDWYWSKRLGGDFAQVNAYASGVASLACHFPLGIDESRCQRVNTLYTGHWKRNHRMLPLLARFRYHGGSIFRRALFLLRLYS